MSFLQKINAVWAKVGIVQRALLIAIVLACVIAGSLLTKWASEPEWRRLYGNLSGEAASSMVDKIIEQGIPYRLSAGGTSIEVPAERVGELKLLMAKNGLLTEAGGYAVLDNQGMGISPAVQDVNILRAKEEETAKNIERIDGIQVAKVTIAKPEASIFTSNEQEVTASIMLTIKPGWQLGPGEIAAITNLVSGGIAGLKSENVTIADNHGRLLSSRMDNNGVVSMGNSRMDYQKRVEQGYVSEIQKTLELVLGPGRSSVTVSVELDMVSETVQTTKYETGIAESEIITTNDSSKGGGTDSDGQPIGNPTTTKDKIIETTSKVPETVTITKDVPGKVVSATVSVVVDLAKPKPVKVAVEGEETAAATPEETGTVELIMSVEDVTKFVRNAIGPDLLKTEESITVINTAFSRPETAQVAEKTPAWPKYIEIAKQSSMGLLAVCALIVLKIFTGASKKAAPAPAAVEVAGQLTGGFTAGLLPAGMDGMEPTMAFRKHITNELKANPEEVKSLFASWLAEEA